jgi:hypothetical protein
VLVRHKDIRTTCNLYMDLGIEDVTEAILKLPALWEMEARKFDGSQPDEAT